MLATYLYNENLGDIVSKTPFRLLEALDGLCQAIGSANRHSLDA